MKDKITATVAAVFTAAILVVGVHSAFAQAGDTLTVYASNPQSLDEVITSDTTSSGFQMHSVYKLVSLDTTYIWLGPITVKSNFEVIGVLGTNGRPPCIQSGILADGSLPYYLFVVNGPHTTAIFKNLYITGLATNNTMNVLNVNGIGAMIHVTADSVDVYVDNVVFSDWDDETIDYSGNWDNFYITNCKFRNMISATQWYSGEALRNEYNSAITDSIVMHDNTFFAINAYASCPVTLSYIRYFDFSHNTVIMTFQNPFWIFNVTNAKIDNNMFYSVWTGGTTQFEYLNYYDELHSIAIPSVIDLDTLSQSVASMFDPADSASSNLIWDAEAKINIQVENNDFYEPDTLIGFWTAYDDTARGADSLYFVPWMNARTTHMFNDPSQWPGLVAKGNMEVNPGYGPSINNMFYPNQGDGVGIFQYFMDIRGNTASTDVYGYQLENVTGITWVPKWPLPESQDMQYTNTALMTGGTDGKPIGDEGWFNGGYTAVQPVVQQVPTKFTLSEAYPNPFNPTAHIEYTVPKSGVVTLQVYNVLGQLVATLASGMQQPGKYVVTFNGDKYASGVYFYRLMSGSVNITKKMVLMK